MPQYKHERITRALADAIARGDEGHQPGDLLPTIPELVQEFEASTITVRRALKDLAGKGLVATGSAEGRRGTIVLRPDALGRTDIIANLAIRPGRPDSDDADAFMEAAELTGRKASKRFERKIEIPPAEVAARLGLQADEPVVVRRLIQLLGYEPWSIETSYYPLPVARAAGLDTADDIKGGTIRTLKAAGLEEIAWADEVIAEKASAEDAQLLGVEPGSDLLIQVRTAATSDKVTRVTSYLRLGAKARLIWLQGDQQGLDAITATRRVETRS